MSSVDHGQSAAAFQNDAQLTRTIIVGLGGTGGRVCARMRKNLLDMFDNDPSAFPHVKFLAIDTDPKRIVVDGVELPKRDIYLARIDMGLDPKKFTPIMAESDITKLLPQANNKGAGRNRTMGNAFLANQWAPIVDQLGSRFTELTSANLLTHFSHPRYAGLKLDSSRINVFVVGNLVSGTGSGMCVGMGYLVRQVAHRYTSMANMDHARVEGVFTLCSRKATAEAAFGAPSQFAVNCYSAMLELNYYSTPSVLVDPRNHFRPGFPEIQLSGEVTGKAPYKAIQLLHPSHFASGEVPYTVLENQIARCLALRTGSPAGAMGDSKTVDELSNSSDVDEDNNPSICYTWGANTFQSSYREVLNLATALAADEVLDAIVGDRDVRVGMSRHEEAWKLFTELGFGFAPDEGKTQQATLLKKLMTPQKAIEGMVAGQRLDDAIRGLVEQAFPTPPNVPEDIHSVGMLLDKTKPGLEARIDSLIQSVIKKNRRLIALECRTIADQRFEDLADFSRNGQGSLDDALAVFDQLIDARNGYFRRDNDAYQAQVSFMGGDAALQARLADQAAEQIKSIAGMGRFNYQALQGAWSKFVKALGQKKVRQAQQFVFEQARQIIDGDPNEGSEALRIGLVKHLQALRVKFAESREKLGRLDKFFEDREASIREQLKHSGTQSAGIVAQAEALRRAALAGDKTRAIAAEVVGIIGPPFDYVNRYGSVATIEDHYRAIVRVLVARLKAEDPGKSADSLDEDPTFGGLLDTMLIMGEPAIRLSSQRRHRAVDVVYFSVPPNTPKFIAAVKDSPFFNTKAVLNKNENELFAVRPGDVSPRVDVITCRMTYSMADIDGVDLDLWAKAYHDYINLRPEREWQQIQRRKVHTMFDPTRRCEFFFEDLGQTAVKKVAAYLVGRAMGWICQDEDDGLSCYLTPDKTDVFATEDIKVVLPSGRLGELPILQDLGLRTDQSRPDSNLIYKDIMQRFKADLLDGEKRSDTVALIAVGMAQVVTGNGALGADPVIPLKSVDGEGYDKLMAYLEQTLSVEDAWKDTRALVQRLVKTSPPALGQIDGLVQVAQPRPVTVSPPPVSSPSVPPVLPAGAQVCEKGHPMDPGDKFCGLCGSGVAVANPQYCANCGFRCEAEAKYCKNCGHKLD